MTDYVFDDTLKTDFVLPYTGTTLVIGASTSTLSWNGANVFELPINTAEAFLISEGAVDYMQINTTTNTIILGSAGTVLSLLGSMSLTASFTVTVTDALATAFRIWDGVGIYLAVNTVADRTEIGMPLYFSAGSGLNQILIRDDFADALTIAEGANPYITLVSTNNAELIKLVKPVQLSSQKVTQFRAYESPVNGVLTPAQIVNGVIGIDNAVTMPAAADLVAYLPGFQVGQTFIVLFMNTTGGPLDVADGGITTVAIPAGPSSVAANSSRAFIVRLTNIGIGTETAEFYPIST